MSREVPEFVENMALRVFGEIVDREWPKFIESLSKSNRMLSSQLKMADWLLSRDGLCLEFPEHAETSFLVVSKNENHVTVVDRLRDHFGFVVPLKLQLNRKKVERNDYEAGVAAERSRIREAVEKLDAANTRFVGWRNVFAIIDGDK